MLGPGSREAGWVAREAPELGRAPELIKLALNALPTYMFTVLKPPIKFYKDLDKLRRKFLWAGDQQIHGGRCKVNWVESVDHLMEVDWD
jgi:hypothetical protein